jgi:hypothetical protein
MFVSNALSCGITYDCHADDSGGVIYNCNMIIVQATGVGVTKCLIVTFNWANEDCTINVLLSLALALASVIIYNSN